MKTTPKLARQKADDARVQVRTTFGDVKSRLHPKTLSAEAVGKVKAKANAMAENAITTAKSKPATSAAMAAAITMFIFRKPLARAIVRAIKEKKNG